MLRKLRFRQKNGFLIKKIVHAIKHGAKALVDITGVFSEISSKIIIFKAGENKLLKYKHFVNNWDRRFKMKLLWVYTPIRSLLQFLRNTFNRFVISRAKMKCRYFITFLQGLFWESATTRMFNWNQSHWFTTNCQQLIV